MHPWMKGQNVSFEYTKNMQSAQGMPGALLTRSAKDVVVKLV